MVAQNSQIVESALLNKAVDALVKHHQSKSSSENKSLLLGDDQAIHVQFSLTRIPEKTSLSVKPIRIEIPHSLNKLNDIEDEDNDKLEEAEVCLIVKDSSKPWVQTLISQFPKELSYIKKVLSLTSLRKKYSQYQDRRTLCNTYTLFLVDDCILPMVGKLLGKTFFMKKKQPVPVKLSRKEGLPFAVEKCIKSTFLTIGAGTCISVKAAYTTMTSKSIAENIQAVVTNVIEHVPRKASNISSISIKMDSSTALPIYNKVRDELVKIETMAKIESRSTKGKKRELEGECDESSKNDQAEETESEKKKQKKEAILKSPLLKALKQNKKPKVKNSDNETRTDEHLKQDKESSKKSDDGNKIKKRKPSLSSTVVTTTMEEAKQGKQDTSSTKAKKELKADSISEKKVDFIASNKYQGSKKGFVFKKGSKGVGYYIDIKPVPDKMAMDALLRSGGKKSSQNSRRQSTGKFTKKGQKKGRRSSY